MTVPAMRKFRLTRRTKTHVWLRNVNYGTQKIAYEAAFVELKSLVRVLRRGDMGDISPIMDEIFDSEHAIKQVDSANKL